MRPILGVQFHPEGGGGPTRREILKEFVASIEDPRGKPEHKQETRTDAREHMHKVMVLGSEACRLAKRESLITAEPALKVFRSMV